jgi:hypothetical protein
MARPRRNGTGFATSFISGGIFMADQNMPSRPLNGELGNQQSLPQRGTQLAPEDVVNRRGSNLTPRRYEQPVEEDEDPVMPARDSTLQTKI